MSTVSKLGPIDRAKEFVTERIDKARISELEKKVQALQTKLNDLNSTLQECSTVFKRNVSELEANKKKYEEEEAWQPDQEIAVDPGWELLSGEETHTVRSEETAKKIDVLQREQLGIERQIKSVQGTLNLAAKELADLRAKYPTR